MRRSLIIVLLGAGLATGCASLSAVPADLQAHDAHAVAVMKFGGWARVRWISLLPVQDDKSACAVSVQAHGKVMLRACADADSQAWLSTLARAQQAMAGLLPDWQRSRWEIDLAGTGPVVHARWSHGRQVPLRLAFAVRDDMAQAQRRVVRSVAHETFHVLEARRGVAEDDGAEYRAHLAGSCIELATFGSVAVEHWQDPPAVVQAASVAPAQARSLAGYLQAAATLTQYQQAGVGASEKLTAHCRALLAGQSADQSGPAAGL